MVGGCAASVVLALIVVAAPAQARVPANFFGTVVDGPALTDPRVDVASELALIRSSGLRSIRTSFNWSMMQPYRRWSEVPPSHRAAYVRDGSVPLLAAQTDLIVGAAAQRGLTVLPVVLTTPSWAARRPAFESPPRNRGDYGRFLAQLVRRYGSDGRFWREHPELPRRPIRHWQLWNEPHFRSFFNVHPFARDYARLLRTGAAAVHRTDPRAKVVLAGLADRSWDHLDAIYRQPRTRQAFDIVAVHPFTDKPSNVERGLRRVRRVMRRHGDSRKPLWVTELSWTSGKGQINPGAMRGWEQTEEGQARRLTQAYTRLGRASVRARLRLQRVYWYTWMSPDGRPTATFDWAGLRTVDDAGTRSKPAHEALRSMITTLRR
ncbi:MAG: hypothetical protein ACR2NA_08160 [Solirubrobacterales bacterium]